MWSQSYEVGGVHTRWEVWPESYEVERRGHSHMRWEVWPVT